MLSASFLTILVNALRATLAISRSSSAPRLAGVIADDVGQPFIGQLELGLFQTVVLDLLGQQVMLGDLALFVLGVVSQRDDLHPVQKRAGHVVAVRRGQEHHVRQVIFDLEIVIDECAVLFRIKNLKHGRCGVTTEILPHLVDFIEQDQRVRGFRFFSAWMILPGIDPI